MNTKRLVPILAVLVFWMTSAFGMSLTAAAGRLPMLEQRVRVNINNQVAVTKLEQTFINPAPTTQEVSYKFPLGEKASVQEFGLTGPNGLRTAGKIEEKQQAAQTYQQAQSHGFMPAVAQQSDPNSFETKIGAVPPNSRATVDVTYSELLDYSNGVIAYNIPMNVSKIQEDALDLVSVVMDIRDQKKIINVKSPSHQINAKKLDDNHWQVSFEQAKELPAADFQLYYEVEAQRMGFNFLSTKPDAEDKGYFMMMLAPQEVVDAADIVARDIVFVMDVSGSMSGYKIEQTKAAYNFFIDHLNPDDRFNVIAFSSTLSPWKETLVNSDPTNRVDAKKFISNLDAAGGTNINMALTQAINSFSKSSSTKAIIFLTDGEPTEGETRPENIAANIKNQNTSGIRIFTVGVGANVSARLLDKLAVENRGEAVYIHENDAIESKLSNFYEKISKPLLVDLSIDWGTMNVSELYPSTLPNVYKGSQVVIVGRYDGSGVASLTIHGTLNGSQQSYPVTASFVANSDENKFVGRIWAKAKADTLVQEMRAYGEREDLKAEVIRLSKLWQFTTPYTSFISVAPEQHAARVQPKIQQNAWRRPAPVSAPTPVQQPDVQMPDYAAQAAVPQGNKQVVTVAHKEAAKPVSMWGVGGFFPAAVIVPNFRKAREQAREKACYANMRVLLGAVEMYNMDHDVMLRMIDDQVIQGLTAGKYLKGNITKPEQCCAYLSAGDLASDGVIYCAIHGTVEDLDNRNLNLPNIKFQDATPWETRFWNNTLQPIMNWVINIPLFLIGLWLSWKLLTLPIYILAELLGGNQKPQPENSTVLPYTTIEPINLDMLSENDSDEDDDVDSEEDDDENESDLSDDKS